MAHRIGINSVNDNWKFSSALTSTVRYLNAFSSTLIVILVIPVHWRVNGTCVACRQGGQSRALLCLGV